jgi:hypothetical protein
MNERFIKLALDAGLLNYVDHETPRRYFISGHAEQEDIEKFAELIVKECFTKLTPYLDDQFIDDIESELKEHFGVK